VAYIVEGDGAPTDDEIISRAAARRKSIAADRNKDSVNCAFRWGRAVPGVVLLRVER